MDPAAKSSPADPREALDPQEIAWKKPRRGRPGTPAELRDQWARVFELVRDGEADAGVRAHRIGTALNVVYAFWGEAVAGERSFDALLHGKLDDSDLPASTAYDYMRLADVTTEAQAGRYGVSKSLVGLQILPFAKVGSLEALEKVDLPVIDRRTRKAARFPATRRLLSRALLEYRLAAAGVTEPGPGLQARLRRHVSAIADTVEKHPELGELRPTAYVHDQKLKLRLGPFSDEHLEGVTALLRRLRKGA